MSSIYDSKGNRKYLTIKERQAFLRVAVEDKPEVHTFCVTLASTGARISEVLALSPQSFDIADQTARIECLKKRQRGIYRAVPVPLGLLSLLNDVHCIRRTQQQSDSNRQRIWPWCRTTAWKHVKTIMVEAGIEGSHANPKGLRHSFGVTALQKEVPLNMVRKWLGHARLSTTAIYADAVGDEERLIAKRWWQSFEQKDASWVMDED